MNGKLLVLILAIFAPLSLVTIGGGQAIVSDVHRQIVAEQHWLSEQQFVEDFALSRLAPGPASLLVTLIGWQVAGWAGALIASVAIFLPSSVLVYGLARIWARYRGAAWQRAIELGLAPIAAGLMLAASLTLLEAARGGWKAWAVALVSTILFSVTRVSPFLVLGAGALVFLATT